jgi:BirA family biotin operon repressor/biotin-[acetyl-CoA-carboxylase] ligase
MDISAWKIRLRELPLGEIHIHHQVNSTNQEALMLAQQGTSDLSLILADSQTAGRGRQGRSWVTIKGKSLAFSLIIYPDPGLITPQNLGKLSGLGALGVAEALEKELRLPALIKWPNDVLVNGKKVSGVLVDLSWIGSQLEYGVVGIGINIYQGSVPDESVLDFPAACLEEFAGNRISRLELLVQVLESMIGWYADISSERFLAVWEDRLAFVNQEVLLVSNGRILDRGKIQGLTEEGALILLSETEEKRIFQSGEIQLRPVDIL